MELDIIDFQNKYSDIRIPLYKITNGDKTILSMSIIISDKLFYKVCEINTKDYDKMIQGVVDKMYYSFREQYKINNK